MFLGLLDGHFATSSHQGKEKKRKEKDKKGPFIWSLIETLIKGFVGNKAETTGSV